MNKVKTETRAIIVHLPDHCVSARKAVKFIRELQKYNCTCGRHTLIHCF